MNLTLESRESFLLATASGRVSLREMVEVCKNICDAASQRGFRNVIFDCVAVEGELSVTERFIAAKTIVDYCEIRSIAVKAALVGNPPTITGLGAQVAWNRGMMVQAFSDRQAAMQWLNTSGSSAIAS